MKKKFKFSKIILKPFIDPKLFGTEKSLIYSPTNVNGETTTLM